MNLFKELPRQTADLTIPAASAHGLDSPVLVDPLQAAVYRLARAERPRGTWRIPGVPLADYPLIVADRSVMELVE